ncbi:hypothetical protein [Sutcliffiella rhizosphaerae]|uniref:ABC transporter permease n=1 Tax=Sutcliffiella rhizosphaerae TaxID=2880967 RepID=A0ABN8A9L7_9BACI|nr:hypothetical protein [Sutcliffiella rhizosphaerae]CAG9621871.1 hypothetical protein BACCIP111883_02662 [Sutcliffiella rhizosphaerae]
MSLNDVSMKHVVIEQLRFKLSAYSGVFLSLVVVQIIAILFSFNGIGMSVGGVNSLNYQVNQFSNDLVFTFTLLWAFISAIILTARSLRNDDFTFVSSRLTSNLSNILFLVIAAVIATVTTELSSFLLRVIIYFLPNTGTIFITPNSFSLEILASGLFATFLYLLLLAGIGYFVGTITRLHPLMNIIVPLIIFGYFILGGKTNEGMPFIMSFFLNESFLFMFFIKCIMTLVILLAVSSWIFNRGEVRQ